MEVFLDWARTLLHTVREHEYLALYLLLTFEEGGVPLPAPGDTVVAYAGHLSATGELIWWLVLAVAIGGSVTGSLPLYWITRSRGRPLLLRYGKFFHLNPQRERRIESWLIRHGGFAVFIGRLIPGLRVGTTAVAGAFAIPFWIFLTYLTLSAIVWWGFWLWLGSVVGRHIGSLLFHFSPVYFIAGIAALAVIGGLILYFRRLATDRRKVAAVVIDNKSETEATS